MNLLNRYIIYEIIKYFCMALVCVLVMFVAIDYLSNMDKFLEAGISLWRGCQYVLYKVPFICSQAIPAVLLIAILIVFGLMSKNNELMAINACGISIYTLVKPVMAVCVGMAIFIFFLTEQLVPYTMLKYNAIRYQEIKKTADISKHEKNIWIKGQHKITHIKFFDPASQAIYGFAQYHFDDQFRLIQRIDARKGEYHDGQWVLADGMVQVLNKANTFDPESFENRKENLELHPKDFKKIVRQSNEMSYGELNDYIRKVENEGYDGTVYKVDLFAKSAYPFICIIMGLVGIGLAGRKELNSGIPLSITYGLAIGFSYWMFQSFCLSIGYGGLLPPLLAAWVANIIFLCSGLLLVLHAE